MAVDIMGHIKGNHPNKQHACVEKDNCPSSPSGHGVSVGAERVYLCQCVALWSLIITHLSSTSTAGGDRRAFELGVREGTECSLATVYNLPVVSAGCEH